MAGNENVYKESMSQGHSAAWDQNWQRAVDFYKAALAEFPERIQALTSLGLAYFELGQYDPALKCYLQAGKLSKDDPLPIEKCAEIFERTGEVSSAVKASMDAADLYLKLRDADKAVRNWTRITSLDPENLKAHSRLALVHERLGRKDQAIREYIFVAALLQDAGQIGEALKTVERGANLDPKNPEGQQALELVKANKTLPKPKSQSASQRMAAVKQLEKPKHVETSLGKDTPDPIAEARQKALTALAELLFDVSADDIDEEKAKKRGLNLSLGKGSGPDLDKIALHLGQAIDLQTRAKDEEAGKEIKAAIDAGLDFPPAYFNLGLIYKRTERMESAIRNLQRAVKHPDYTLACRLMIGEYEREQGRLADAATHYLEALKIAEMIVMNNQEMAELLRQNYEPLIEAQSQETDETQQNQLIDNIIELLNKTNWRKQILSARQQLPTAATGSLLTPLAQILTQANSSEMVEMIARINDLARRGFLRTAMEEAFSLMSDAPTYLPLHVHMAELLLRQERVPQAITKFTMVANTYSARGEARQATNLLRRVVEISPMDLRSRTRLIDQLIAQGEVEDAMEEYLALADMHYRLAELDNARNAYERALRVAQQFNAPAAWNVRILHHMADIDMQKLDWRKAVRVYEQLRTFDPSDMSARRHLVELNVNLGNERNAATELDNYISYLSGQAKDADLLTFLEDLVKENPELIFGRQRLAESYQQATRVDEAIQQWDKVGEMLADKGDMEGAKVAIRAILLLNPPNAEEYRAMLQKLG